MFENIEESEESIADGGVIFSDEDADGRRCPHEGSVRVGTGRVARTVVPFLPVSMARLP